VQNSVHILIALIGIVGGIKISGIIIAFIVLIIAIKTNGIGGGDVKLIAAISVTLGLTNSLVMLFIACSAQLVFCIFIKHKTLPFVPFITFGYVTILLL
jgi:leader peptidase (prepilin peptidase)/N-methyltransferase